MFFVYEAVFFLLAPTLATKKNNKNEIIQKSSNKMLMKGKISCSL